jgi:hypothetical protein
MVKIPICLFLLAAVACAATDAPPVPFESLSDLAPQGRIDALVFARLKQLGIQPAKLASDAVFLRRVYLDAIGTLPTPEEAAAFLQDRAPGKRVALIDSLLDRPEFAEYWALKWSDLLRIKAEFPINLWPNAAQTYHHWIVASLRENQPYDRLARELLTESGSNFRAPQVNFYRAMQSREPAAIAQTVALTLMGVRAEKWPKEKLALMAGFFAQVDYKATGEWKEEIVYFNPAKPAAPAAFPDGAGARIPPGRDPRQVFADWLISPKNPWFARNIVNRVWSWLLGRGIVQEPDDIRPDNPPSNPELLAWLEQELVKSHYDLKHIYRLILNSSTYQLSSIPPGNAPEAAANFAFYPLRRLDAEVLIDALCQITGISESYTSAIPEPFTYIPEGQRSISLPDGSISSAFLELFGKPPRDTGLEAERNNRPAAAQSLHMLNSSHVERKIEDSPKMQSVMKNTRDPMQLVTWLYLAILSRYPADDELKAVGQYAKSAGVRPREAFIDLAWALINGTEFQYRH